MRRAILSLGIILYTALWTFAAYMHNGEEAMAARIVTVQRGDVHQVAAITGRLGYADERYVFAQTSGVISQICVKDQQRLAAGDAILRTLSDWQLEARSAYAAYANLSPEVLRDKTLPSLDDTMVIRVDQDCTVRQLLVQENALVTAGTPVARLTSHRQHILCNTAACDTEQIATGMWAWLYVQGEEAGKASVLSIGQETADAATGMIHREVVLLPEQPLDLPEGAAVDVYVYLAGSDDVMTLPVEAITERDTVWWHHDGICTEIPAQIVMTDEINAWVRLPEGIEIAVGEFSDNQRIVEAQP